MKMDRKVIKQMVKSAATYHGLQTMSSYRAELWFDGRKSYVKPDLTILKNDCPILLIVIKNYTRLTTRASWFKSIQHLKYQRLSIPYRLVGNYEDAISTGLYLSQL